MKEQSFWKVLWQIVKGIFCNHKWKVIENTIAYRDRHGKLKFTGLPCRREENEKGVKNV